jgi:hypothetical protein
MVRHAVKWQSQSARSGHARWEIIMTSAQINALQMLIDHADTYHDECEDAQYSDTDELWCIIKAFAGVSQQIIDTSQEG